MVASCYSPEVLVCLLLVFSALMFFFSLIFRMYFLLQSIGFKGILLYGTDAQKEKYLPKVCVRVCVCMCVQVVGRLVCMSLHVLALSTLQVSCKCAGTNWFWSYIR